MSALGEKLVPTKINYDLFRFKTDLRPTHANNNHPLMKNERGMPNFYKCKILDLGYIPS